MQWLQIAFGRGQVMGWLSVGLWGVWGLVMVHWLAEPGSVVCGCGAGVPGFSVGPLVDGASS